MLVPIPRRRRTDLRVIRPDADNPVSRVIEISGIDSALGLVDDA